MHNTAGRVIAEIGEKKRVVVCGAGLQWIIQTRSGRPGKEYWKPHYFCQTSKALLRDCKNTFGDLPEQFLQKIDALPPHIMGEAK